MSRKKDKASRPSALEAAFPEGFAPKPTVYQGGLDRMIQCWTALRARNTGGWGARRLVTVEGWSFKEHLGGSIACSPFTGTVIAMVFDPDCVPTGAHFKPVFDGADQRPLPRMFYDFHNTSLAKEPKKGRITVHDAIARLGTVKVTQKRGMAPMYGCTGSAALWNLGYEIDPRDMRRGDLVHFDRLPPPVKPGQKKKHGGGHATFCWDAHLNADGEVDCFLIMAANGSHADANPGISVSASPKGFFIEKSGGKFRVKPQWEPYFTDRPEFVERGNWKIVPGHKFTEESIRKAGGFKPSTPKEIGEVKECHALRFWGFPPPDRATPRGQKAWADTRYSVNFARALELTKYALVEPYCMGGGGRRAMVSVPALTAVTIAAEHLAKPEDVQRVATKPAAQKAEHATPEQLEVERALDTLYRAKLIDAGPGDLDNVHDADTVKAIRAFQRRFDLKEDGKAGRVTRPLLFKIAEEVRAGKTHVAKPAPEVARPPRPGSPAAPTPPAPTVMLGPVTGAQPHVDRFYFLHNHARPGDEVTFAVEGRDLDVWNFSPARLTLTEVTRGTRVDIITPVPFTVGGHGEASVKLPKEVAAGTAWRAVLDCEVATGVVRAECPVVLEVGDRHPAEPVADAGGWPWDEALWPRPMRAIVAELRATPRPEGPLTERWCFSTYGVKEKMNSVGPRDRKTGAVKYADGGDVVPVLDKSGAEYGRVTRYSLYAADIEGTMRLGGRVLNITQTGRARHGKPPHRYEEFDPSASRWHDVTARHPWGSGSRVPLIPYRVLAINAGADGDRYLQKVYVKALDGVRLPPTGEVHNGVCVVGDCGSMDPGRQFDFFKGRQDIAFKIDGGLGRYTNSKGVSLPLSDVAFLDACESARRPKRAR